jgi:phosphoglucosamine mutase
MKRAMFGTDGVRGRANVEPMTSETALKLGRACAHVFRDGARRHRVLIGKDTRLSGYMLESALTSGICSMGVDVVLVGPLPTPGIAFMTRSLRADAGVVISASHNPYEDNGIKFFSREGYKLPDALEAEIEDLVFSGRIDHVRPTAEEIGKAFRADDAVGRYVEFAKSTFPRELTLAGLRIVVDCANGAAYKVAPEVLRELGAEVTVLNAQPDGRNINLGCGSTHPEVVCAAVRRARAHVGLTFDGDADRVLFSDERGRLVDGDQTLAVCALDLQARGQLPGGTVVGTVMSNYGLELALRAAGLALERTPVGDRAVVEAMQRGGYALGGEQSGHIVFSGHQTTGDGMVTALQVLAVMQRAGRTLSALAGAMRRLPQVLLNVPTARRVAVESHPAIGAAVARAEAQLAGRGRVLVRASGTEPKVRVMVEGRDRRETERVAAEIVQVVAREVGEQSPPPPFAKGGKGKGPEEQAPPRLLAKRGKGRGRGKS